MPIDPNAFAQAWIAAWNAHDLDAILSHYAVSIVFLSPYAERVTGSGRIEGIEPLRAYWQRGLQLNADLHFELEAVLVGYGTVTILYRNHRGQRVAETVEFDGAGKVVRSYACYEN
jgi:ketosteroid isomerase-like protein